MDSERALDSGLDAIELDPNLYDEAGNDKENGNLEKKVICSGSDFFLGCPDKINKILELNSMVEVLKKDYSMIASEVKSLTAELVTDSELYENLRLFGEEYVQSKNKCMFLEKKYIFESGERKRLYNELIKLKGYIRVFCRCRPLHPTEAENGSSVIEFDSCSDNDLHVTSTDSSVKQFKFDYVFKPEDTQEAVFSQTAPVVTSVLDGYNVCIFAYGQTGTGKTFTMEGTPENRGVNYRTLEELFRLSNGRRGVMTYELSVSMLEVYNDKIRDLLADSSAEPDKKLEIKQTPEGSQDVPGLVETRVHSTDEVWDLLMTGSRARSVGSTNANELSSRSHCLLRVTVKRENLVNGQRIKSHLWLVDLAGSERVGKIEVEGERLKESQNINKSLSALGDVIYALASKSSHVPYRNSKLTHLLQSSLGGDCKTMMFVQVSPSASDLGETLCSLNFASRVRGIKTDPAQRQNDTSELFKYKQLAEKQKHDEKELKKLQDKVQSLQLRVASKEHICIRFQDKVRDLENQLADERRIRLKQETKSLAAASCSFISKQPLAVEVTQKKPPLATKRIPLREISNCMTPPPSYKNDKESLQIPSKSQIKLRKRVYMAQRKARYSRLFAPSEMTPASMKSTSKFMGSPPTQPGSRIVYLGLPVRRCEVQFGKRKHSTVFALQLKTLVWRPLKTKKTFRKASMLPVKPTSYSI